MTDSIETPARIAKMPKDQRGYFVPWFVQWIDGVPDFRVVDFSKLPRAVNERLCWICGEPLGRFKAFVIGPMCAINRISAEPPSHRECAVYAAQVCPFLSNPAAPRRETNMPKDHTEMPGVTLKRNPGVTLVWVTLDFQILRAGQGVLFQVGDPVQTLWYARGRAATGDEVRESIRTGLPSLEALADQDGPLARAELKTRMDAAMALVPA